MPECFRDLEDECESQLGAKLICPMSLLTDFKIVEEDRRDVIYFSQRKVQKAKLLNGN